MKTEISRDSHQVEKRYSGVYQQQGRMLTDADWNELVDILKSRLNEALKDVVGGRQGSIGGTPRLRALRIIEDDGVKIQPGHIYIDGMAASLPGDGPLEFDQQPDFPGPPSIPAENYVLYADIWERTVTHLIDERLRDKGLHGADTCSRKQMLAQIKWCPAGTDPKRPDQNPAKGDAGLTLTLRRKATAPDTCDPCAAELDIDTRVGNYLFRVEVHDVWKDIDNHDKITLKWSSENGAEQSPALANEDKMPADFIGDKWVYEFFDETSERHLGVHLTNTDWRPARVGLREFSETSGAYSVPSIPGSMETQTFVRRWDGYCELDLTDGELLEGMDRGVELATDKAVNSLGYVKTNTILKIALNSLFLELELDDKSFVAGDFWMADVREAEHIEGSVLLDNKPPQGIEHHYLTLGSVSSGGVLQPNPEIDRKYAFPPLTQMTRLFMAGGDGQEIVPGEKLPQPLRVGVANGEWPVEGATVRFKIVDGDDSDVEDESDRLTVINDGLTNAEGIAECIWEPNAAIGATFRVKASLVDPNNLDSDDTSSDVAPSVYFYANLVSADQVAYAPECKPDTDESTVHHLLLGTDNTLESDGYYTVKKVLDALLCELKADHIPYEAADCDDHTVKTLLENLHYNDDDLLTVKDVLDTLLCCLKADNLPLNRNADLCPSLKDDGNVITVQDALNHLCENMGGAGCAVTVVPGSQFTTLDEALTELELQNCKEVCICLLPGPHMIEEELELSNKDSIRISGCGTMASSIHIVDKLTLNAAEIQLRDLSIIGARDKNFAMGKGKLTLAGIKGAHFIIQNCIFNRMFRGDKADWSPLVSVDSVEGSVKLDWHRNKMIATRMDGKIIEAAIPDKGELAGAGPPVLETAKTLGELLTSNPYTDPKIYAEKVKDVAKSIGDLSSHERNTLFNARPVDKINNLPDKLVKINRINRIMLDRSGLAGKMGLIDAYPLVGTQGETMRMAFEVSQKTAAKDFYEDIVKKEVNVDIVIDRITVLASLVTSFDYALALASNEVGGSITQNEILGNVALHFNNVALHFNKGAKRLEWPSTEPEKRREHKLAFVENFTNAAWPIKQQLSFNQNKVNEVHSMVPMPQMETILHWLNNGKGVSLEIAAYESAFIGENVFLGEKNSFMSRFLNLTNNHFLFQDNKGATLAYLLGYRGVITGNHSMGDKHYTIDQILHDYLPKLEGKTIDDSLKIKTNFLKII